jgi:hypothetical protein
MPEPGSAIRYIPVDPPETGNPELELYIAQELRRIAAVLNALFDLIGA